MSRVSRWWWRLRKAVFDRVPDRFVVAWRAGSSTMPAVLFMAWVAAYVVALVWLAVAGLFFSRWYWAAFVVYVAGVGVLTVVDSWRTRRRRLRALRGWSS